LRSAGLTGLLSALLLTRAAELARLLSGLPRRARLLQALPAGCCAWLLGLTRTVLLTGLPRLTGPGLAGLAVRAVQTGLLSGLADRPVRIDEIRIGLAEGTPLLEHAAADRLRSMHLADKTLVALQHLRRD